MAHAARVLILGGGIAGVAAALAFRKRGFEVELVTDRPYLYIFPLSIWVPVRLAAFSEVTIPLSELARKHGFELTIDRVSGIDRNSGTVTLEASGSRIHSGTVVIALGAGKVPCPGIEHTLSICGVPEQALALRDRIDCLSARGYGRIAIGFGGSREDPSAVRGGPAFELLFNLHYRLTQLGIRERFELTFFSPMPSPGAKMGAKALGAMDRMFTSKKINKRVGTGIVRFDDTGVILSDGSTIASDLTMFIPACRGHEVVRNSGLPQNAAGFITIDDHCRIAGMENWYAIGDAAALEGPEWKAKQGHLAEVMADCAAAHAAALLKGQPRGGELPGYGKHLQVLCVMDTGDGAGLVYRDQHRELFLPLPVAGHWLKKLWGGYYKFSKTGHFAVRHVQAP